MCSVSVSVRSQRGGLNIGINDTGYYVSATILKGKDPFANMAQQPWHCDHAMPGDYSGHHDFPFVVVFPLMSGDCYRCNVVLPKAQVIGEISLHMNDILFMRGDTIHGGAAIFFLPRVHLYVERNTLPRRAVNTTFLVSDATILSIIHEADQVKHETEG